MPRVPEAPAVPMPRVPDPVPGGGAAPDAGSAGSGADCPYPLPQPSEWAPEPWSPVSGLGPAELLAAVQASLPGRWEGLATTPWTTPYRVELTFREDGTYSAHCTEFSNDCCTAFYYGSDLDSSLKRYRVGDATLSGNVFGELDIAFIYGDEEHLAGWQGELSHIEIDASGNGLRFEFARSDGYGPLAYDLRRLPEDE